MADGMIPPLPGDGTPDASAAPPGTEGATPGFTVAEAPAHDAELHRLAALDPIAYDQARQAAAEAIGCRVSILDEQVQARRPMPEAATGKGVSLPDVDPWPHPVRAGALLDDLTAAVRKHVILRPAAAEAVALWVAHTWVADRFQHTPRLGITSPAKRCGKSTLLDVLRATCHRPLKADNISASGVFRTVEALAPLTLLLDEADSFLGENEELRGVLNSGFERSGEVIRVVEVQGEHQPVRFRTFAPLALAGIGALPSTLEDRAVPVVLQRKGAAETATKLRAPGARAALADLARKLARWSGDRARFLPTDPAIPDAMGDREGDVSVPLLAIADDAGGEWPKRARAALLDLFGKREADGGNAEAGALLLADVRTLFGDKGATRLPSAVIVAALGAMEERPWPEWRQGKPITATQLARALAPFGARPQNFRNTQGVFKGYARDSFADAWARYLPGDAPAADTPSRAKGGSGAATPLQRCSNKQNSPSRAATQGGAVAAPNGHIPLQDQQCSGVAAREGGSGGRDVAGDALTRWDEII